MKQFVYISFAILVLFFCTSLRNTSNEDAYTEAFKYILKNRSHIGWEKKRDPAVYLSEEVISFNTLSVLPDLMSKNKINNFSMHNIRNNQLKIVAHVTDSLQALDTRLNLDYMKKNVWRKTVSTPEKPDFILFFSEIKSDMLYAELLQYDNQVFKDKKLETISNGKAFTYLFLLNGKQEIKKIFTGFVNNN